MTVSVYYELDQGNNVFDDYNLKLGMGDMGTLSFSGNSSSGSGVDKLKISYQRLHLYTKQQMLLIAV